MSEYGRIDMSEGIDINKTDVPHQYIICHFWYFFKGKISFKPKVYDRCHDLMQKAMSFNDVAIDCIHTGRTKYKILDVSFQSMIK